MKENDDDKFRESARVAIESARRQLREGLAFSIVDARPSRIDPTRVAFLIRTAGAYLDASIEIPIRAHDRILEDNPPYACIVAGGAASALLPEDRFYWEVDPPGVLAARWAGRYQQGDGIYQTETVEITDDPPSLDAVVIELLSSRRFRFRLLSFSPAGYPNFDMMPLGLIKGSS